MDKNYFCSIEFGSLNIRLVVLSYNNGNLNVVGKSVVPCQGYQNFEVYDSELLDSCVKKALDEVRSKYKIDVNEAILVLPSNDQKIYSVRLTIKVMTERQIIGNLQIQGIRNRFKSVQLADDELFIEEVPVQYILDNGRVMRTPPLGVSSSTLEIKSNVNTLPKHKVLDLVNCLARNNVKVIDYQLAINCTNHLIANEFGFENECIKVHVGQDVTTLGAYSKNVLVKTSQLDFGNEILIKYLSQTLKVSKEEALDLFNSYFVCNPDFASDFVFDQEKNLSEKRISGICINKLSLGLFEKIKDSINQFKVDCGFNDECKYYVSGDMNDFEFFVDELSENTGIRFNECPIDVIGIGSQSFANCYGAIENYLKDNHDEVIEKIKNSSDVEINKEDGTVTVNTPLQNKGSRFKDIFDD